MQDIKCTECKQCNSKGKPSVSKGSPYCLRQKGILPKRDESSSFIMTMYHFIMNRTRGINTKKKEEEY